MKTTITLNRLFLPFFCCVFCWTTTFAQNTCPAQFFNNQAAIDNFANEYPNCTHVEGSLTILTNATTGLNLDALRQIQMIDGDLNITANPTLQNLAGLERLKFIGGKLLLVNNESLNLITALDSLNYVGSEIVINENTGLLTLVGLDNVGVAALNKVTIINNAFLNVCNVASICNYLTDGGPSEISDNKTNCNSVTEILEACLTPTQNLTLADQVTLYPNPTIDWFQIASDLSLKGQYKITNLWGRLVTEGTIPDQQQLDLSAEPSGMYQIELLIGDQYLVKRIIRQ